MSQTSRDLGTRAEQLVLEHYQGQGYYLVCRNFQYYNHGRQGRLGEIDLIVRKENRLHLIEVKARSNLMFGNPLEQVTKQKLTCLYKTYQYFLSKSQYQIYRSFLVQIDIACLLDSTIDIIPNAYTFDNF